MLLENLRSWNVNLCRAIYALAALIVSSACLQKQYYRLLHSSDSSDKDWPVGYHGEADYIMGCKYATALCTSCSTPDIGSTLH